MKGKVVTCLVSLALLFITASFSQADTFDLAKMNSPPTEPSVPSGPTSGSSGTYYGYTTKSIDPDGNQIRYTIDWGDGTVSTTCLVNQGLTIRVFHKWSVSSGTTDTFDVRVKATDRYGLASDWSSSLPVTITGSSTTSINNPPSTPSTPSGSTSGSSGISYSYTTRANDPDGDKVKYSFDWGDGTISATSLVSSGTAASAPHTWTVASGSTKTFSVRSKATDENGKASAWSSPLSVTIKGSAISSDNNPPSTPSIPSGSTSGSSGMLYRYSTKAIDPDGDRVKYIFDWGDGTVSTTSLLSSGASASGSHIWNVDIGSTKTFSVRSKATDEKGMESVWSSPLSVTIKGSSASIENYPPSIPSIPSGPATGSSGISYGFTTKSSDPDKDQIRYIFDWGDGTASSTCLVSPDITIRVFHKWAVASGSKTFDIRVKSMDEHGMTSSYSSPSSITITNEALPSINSPPAAPSVPSGSTSGSSGTAYSYSAKASDPDGDRVKYTFDWGDGTTSATSLVASGTAASAPHTWTVAAGTTKTFSVKAKTTDEKGLESGWSSALSVTITGPAAVNNPPDSSINSLRFHIGQLRVVLQLLCQDNRSRWR